MFEISPLTLKADSAVEEVTKEGKRSHIQDAWLKSVRRFYIQKVRNFARRDENGQFVDTRSASVETLLEVLANVTSKDGTNALQDTVQRFAKLYQEIDSFVDQANRDNPALSLADGFQAAGKEVELSKACSELSRRIGEIGPQRLEQMIEFCIRLHHSFNIISEVERLTRTQGSDTLLALYERARDNHISLQEIDELVVIWTSTAHPNRFMSLNLEKSTGELIDALVHSGGTATSSIIALGCTVFRAPIIPFDPPKRIDEASYIARTHAESTVVGLRKLFRADLAARRRVFGPDATAPTYRMYLHMWPTFDWDGQPNPDGQETIQSVKRNRDLACAIMGDSIDALIGVAPQHIEVSMEGEVKPIRDWLSRFRNRLRILDESKPISQAVLIVGLEEILAALRDSPDVLNYATLIDDLEEVLFLARNIGMHLSSGEHRQNSQFHETVLDQLSPYLNLSGYLQKEESERILVLSSLLKDPGRIALAGDEIRSNLDKLGIEARQHMSALYGVRECLGLDPSACDRAIISLTTTASDILEVELLLRLAGINNLGDDGRYKGPLLEIVPLFERPEDKLVCDAIYRGATLASHSFTALLKHFGRVSAMAGYSDGQMRGGPGDRELSRVVEQKLFEVATELGIRFALEHGIGPGVGRGGGYNGDQSMLTPTAVKTRYIHFTIQGTAIGKLLRVPDSATRQGVIALKNYIDGLTRARSKELVSGAKQNKYEAAREESYALARTKYLALTRRGQEVLVGGTSCVAEDLFFAALCLVFPPEYLSGLNQVSRPLFRIKQAEGKTLFNGLQDNPNIWVSYEDFRAVPNSQISDGTRLCFLSLYSWGEILSSVRKQHGDDFLREMYANDRAFQADFNGALLALQTASIPFSLALYRGQYQRYIEKPVVQELYRILELIESDYRVFLDGLDVLDPVVSKRVLRTNREVRNMRSLKDPTVYVLQVLRTILTRMNHERFMEGFPSDGGRFEDWPYARAARLTSVAVGSGFDNAS